MPRSFSYATADAHCMPECPSVRPVPVYIPPVVKDERNMRGKAGTDDTGPTAPEEIDRRVRFSSSLLRNMQSNLEGRIRFVEAHSLLAPLAPQMYGSCGLKAGQSSEQGIDCIHTDSCSIIWRRKDCSNLIFGRYETGQLGENEGFSFSPN